MDCVVEFSELAVVGRVRGKQLGVAFLRSWVDNTWGSNISLPPSICLLAKGWFSFVFSASTDVFWVLSKTWSMVGTPIVLKRWTPNFDAKWERVDVVPVWVRLSGLPMQYWNPVHFSAIGNKLGEFIEADLSFEDTGLMSVARILVRLDLRLGLLKEMTIETTLVLLFSRWIMRASLSGVIDAMFMGMELRIANFLSRGSCGAPWEMVLLLRRAMWIWGPGLLGVPIRLFQRFMTLAGTWGGTPVHLLVLLRVAWTWIEQRFRSPQSWLVQGLSWCRVRNSLLFLWFLLLYLLICCFRQDFWGWMLFLLWVPPLFSPSLTLRRLFVLSLCWGSLSTFYQYPFSPFIL
jgi:hypothetical protein